MFPHISIRWPRRVKLSRASGGTLPYGCLGLSGRYLARLSQKVKYQVGGPRQYYIYANCPPSLARSLSPSVSHTLFLRTIAYLFSLSQSLSCDHSPPLRAPALLSTPTYAPPLRIERSAKTSQIPHYSRNIRNTLSLICSKDAWSVGAWDVRSRPVRAGAALTHCYTIRGVTWVTRVLCLLVLVQCCRLVG